MGDVWISMHFASDTVPTNLCHNTDAFLSGELLDRRTDIAEARALTNNGDANVATSPRDVDNALRVGTRLADEERGACVSVEAVYLSGDIDVDDVSRLE